MEPSNKPAGGQPANLRAGTPAIFNPTAKASVYWLAGLPLTSEAAAAEAKRLRKTIALAEEALREAADHRSERHAPGETAGETQDRWSEAARIETAAKACRKAARKALAAVAVFPDVWSDEEIRAKIEAARAAALDLKHAIDLAQRDHAQRQIRLAARDLKRQIADCAAIEAGKAAEAAKAARKKGGAK